jgi:hypothetical protein
MATFRFLLLIFLLLMLDTGMVRMYYQRRICELVSGTL